MTGCHGNAHNELLSYLIKRSSSTAAEGVCVALRAAGECVCPTGSSGTSCTNQTAANHLQSPFLNSHWLWLWISQPSPCERSHQLPLCCYGLFPLTSLGSETGLIQIWLYSQQRHHQRPRSGRVCCLQHFCLFSTDWRSKACPVLNWCFYWWLHEW